jgi:hypothetical protein
MNHLVLPYHADAIRIFERVRHLPFAVLLHSADRRSPGPHYDIVAADPLRVITYDDAVLRVGSVAECRFNSFDALRRAHLDRTWMRGASSRRRSRVAR